MRHRLSYLFLALLAVPAWVLATPLSSPGVESSPPKKPDSTTPIYGGTYRRPLDQDPLTLDPAKLNDIYGRAIVQQIFDGLVEYDEAMQIQPAIAESWMASRDGLTWTFKLRRSVRFHNGREVTAEDFVYSFTRLLDPQTARKEALLFYTIQGAEEYRRGQATAVSGLKALDRYTLEIKLTRASIPFIEELTLGYAKVVPREEVEARGASFETNPVGTGPFRLVRWIRNKEIVLEANRSYFRGAPYLDKVIYPITYPATRQELLARFEKGSLEDTELLPLTFPQDSLRQKYTVVRQTTLRLRFIGINNSLPPFTDRRVRQALNYAIDRRTMIKETYNHNSWATAILPPPVRGHHDRHDLYPYNPPKAKTLLAEAGYPDGKGLPIFHIWTVAPYEEVLQENTMIRKYLDDIGVTAMFHFAENWPSFNSDVYAGKLPLFRYSYTGAILDPYEFLHNLFYSESKGNFLRYRNLRVDTLIKRAENERDPTTRYALYRQAEDLILEDAPMILIGYGIHERVFQPYVRGAVINPRGYPYMIMRKIWLDRRPTR